jgi:hypothetical protein
MSNATSLATLLAAATLLKRGFPAGPGVATPGDAAPDRTPAGSTAAAPAAAVSGEPKQTDTTYCWIMPTEPNFHPDVARTLDTLAITRAVEQLDGVPLWRVEDAQGKPMLYERASGLLWQGAPDMGERLNLEAAEATGAKLELGGLQQWRLPTPQEFRQFAAAPKSAARPLRGPGVWGEPAGVWRTTVGVWDTGASKLVEGGSNAGNVVFANDFAGDLSPDELVELCLERGWKLLADDSGVNVLPEPDAAPARQLLADIDYMMACLPRLDAPLFSDPAGGLWELWGTDPLAFAHTGLRARNPTDDVRDWDVAIDFGTSCTVVAYNQDGRRKLLRVGIGRFWEDEQPGNYENPTALQFLDMRRALEAWQAVAYRPPVVWRDVRCSHAAVEALDDLDTMHGVVSRVLTGLKQWALRGDRDARIHIRDRMGHIHELAPLAARNPVRGAPLEVGPDDSFDPIELYAWYLGMHINWRGRGIFLRYYMSFPVAYPEDVRDRILASFRRGLQRSLPATLVHQPAFADFRVEELASEPAAYAAAALPALDIEPTGDGVAYAVFDFGGGTTDFAFGKYRLPRPDEDEEWEEVLEHWGASGDMFLGGEHLLANMAYGVFQANLDKCASLGITFSKPQDAADFSGHEMFVSQTRIAGTNTAVLAAALRPVWEGRAGDQWQDLRVRLLDRDGTPVDVALDVSAVALEVYLSDRIGAGVKSFFFAMHKAFGDAAPVVHVLLAGNASRSRIVEDYFFCNGDADRFAQAADYLGEAYEGATVPDIVVHRAPDIDDRQPGLGKTGVALGLLRLCPGSAVVTTDVRRTPPQRQAPFGFYVGRIRRGKFQPVLHQSQAYGEWADLGSPRDRVLRLVFSRSALAVTGQLDEGHTDLSQRRLEFGADADGRRVLARAIGPHEIEVGIASSVEAALEGHVQESRRIQLA